MVIPSPPDKAAVRPSPQTTGEPIGERTPVPDSVPKNQPLEPLLQVWEALDVAVLALREQLQHERQRADAAEEQMAVLRSEHIEARIEAAEASGLRRLLDAEAAERRRLTALLTAQRQAAQPAKPVHRSWWPWRRR